MHAFPRHSLVLAAALIAATVALAQPAPSAPPATLPVRAPRNDGTRPEPKVGDERFDKLHKSFVERDKQGNVDLLFLGDSITAGWNSRAKDLFASRYGPRNAANFGIGGDHVYNVLWRLQNSEFDTIKPKVVVLMIGTNDSSSLTGEQIANANKKIIDEIQSRSPATKVLLLAIFPRGPHTDPKGKVDDGVARMAVIRDANTRLARLDDSKRVRFLDISDKFVVDGKIPDSIMPDQLHPSADGYVIWANAMQPLLDDMFSSN